MKSKRILTWVISGVLYLVLVIVGYSVYASYMGEPSVPQDVHGDHSDHGDVNKDFIWH